MVIIIYLNSVLGTVRMHSSDKKVPLSDNAQTEVTPFLHFPEFLFFFVRATVLGKPGSCQNKAYDVIDMRLLEFRAVPLLFET